MPTISAVANVIIPDGLVTLSYKLLLGANRQGISNPATLFAPRMDRVKVILWYSASENSWAPVLQAGNRD